MNVSQPRVAHHPTYGSVPGGSDLTTEFPQPYDALATVRPDHPVLPIVARRQLSFPIGVHRSLLRHAFGWLPTSSVFRSSSFPVLQFSRANFCTQPGKRPCPMLPTHYTSSRKAETLTFISIVDPMPATRVLSHHPQISPHSCNTPLASRPRPAHWSPTLRCWLRWHCYFQENANS